MIKVPKSVKRILATIDNPHAKGQYLRSMMDAIDTQEKMKKQKIKEPKE